MLQLKSQLHTPLCSTSTPPPSLPLPTPSQSAYRCRCVFRSCCPRAAAFAALPYPDSHPHFTPLPPVFLRRVHSAPLLLFFLSFSFLPLTHPRRWSRPRVINTLCCLHARITPPLQQQPKKKLVFR